MKQKGGNPNLAYCLAGLDARRRKNLEAMEKKLVTLDESTVMERILELLFQYIQSQSLPGYVFYSRTIHTWTQPSSLASCPQGIVESLRDLFVRLSELIHQAGASSLETMKAELNDPLIRLGLKMIVDGSEPEITREVIQNRLGNREFEAERICRLIQTGFDCLLDNSGPEITRIRLDSI